MRSHLLGRAVAVVSLALLLASCGGGGGGTATDTAGASPGGDTSATPGGGGGGTTTPPPQTLAAMVDSYGATMPSSFDNGNASAAGVDGTAADGAPIANASVQVFDKVGHSVTATTDANGVYHARIDDFEPPMIAVVTRPDGSKWYSPSVAAPVKRGFIHINVTGLTDKIAYDVAVSAGKARSADLTMADIAVQAASVASAKANLGTTLSSLLAGNGLDPNTFDPVTHVFKADRTGHDKVLESLRIKNSTGRTVITRKHSVAGTISGLGGATGLQLTMGGEVLDIPANATSFRFTHLIAEGEKYRVSFVTQPKGVLCDSTGPEATMGSSDVANVGVGCRNAPMSMFAGDSYEHGTVDGTAGAARFDRIIALASDSNGNIYVNDNGVLRKVSPSGLVTTLAGGQKVAPEAFGTFHAPEIFLDASGNLYFLSGDGNFIRKMTPAGVISTVGSPFINTSGGTANPRAIDGGGNIYLSAGDAVYRLSASGTLAVFAGSRGQSGNVDGDSSAARFGSVEGLAIDGLGNLFVADQVNHSIRRISPDGVVTTVATADARINAPAELAVAGNDVYVRNYGTSQVLLLSGVANTQDARSVATTTVVGPAADHMSVTSSGTVITSFPQFLWSVP